MNHPEHKTIPEPPYIWPVHQSINQTCQYIEQNPFHTLACISSSAFGTVTAINDKGIEMLRDCLTKNEHFEARLILSVYPTCLTSEDNLSFLRQVATDFSDRLIVYIKPYGSIADRPTNAICFINKEQHLNYLFIGPSENLGCNPNTNGKVNFIFRADPVLVKSFNNYFTCQWSESRNILAGNLPELPALVIPEGTAEAARLWRDFCNACIPDATDPAAKVTVQVDPQTGEIQLISSDGKTMPSPGEEVGLTKIDYISEKIARLYEKGLLVSIDKLSRIPPLDAPLDPSWFGDSSEIQHGIITRKLSMRISIIDEKTLKEIDKYRRKMRELLNKFSFSLAENMRWIPNTATELFEKEISRINEDGQKLIDSLLKGDAESFVQGKIDILLDSLNNMYKDLGKKGNVDDDVIHRVVNNLTTRIAKAKTANLMPKLTYANVVFNTATNTWAAPWGQAYTLLSGIAAFPRKALSDPFFFRGLKVNEEKLIHAMNVADDAIIRDMANSWTSKIKDRCKFELTFLTTVEKSIIEPHVKCDLVYKLIKGKDLESLNSLLYIAEKEKEKEQVND